MTVFLSALPQRVRCDARPPEAPCDPRILHCGGCGCTAGRWLLGVLGKLQAVLLFHAPLSTSVDFCRHPGQTKDNVWDATVSFPQRATPQPHWIAQTHTNTMKKLWCLQGLAIALTIGWCLWNGQFTALRACCDGIRSHFGGGSILLRRDGAVVLLQAPDIWLSSNLGSSLGKWERQQIAQELESCARCRIDSICVNTSTLQSPSPSLTGTRLHALCARFETQRVIGVWLQLDMLGQLQNSWDSASSFF